jgi:hypothetical protein
MAIAHTLGFPIAITLSDNDRLRASAMGILPTRSIGGKRGSSGFPRDEERKDGNLDTQTSSARKILWDDVSPDSRDSGRSPPSRGRLSRSIARSRDSFAAREGSNLSLTLRSLMSGAPSNKRTFYDDDDDNNNNSNNSRYGTLWFETKRSVQRSVI